NMNSKVEILGLVIGMIGFIGTTAVTGMPQWRVTAFIEDNIVIFEARWEGLWMNCFRQHNIRMQCKVYDSLLALTPDLQAARGLMSSAVVLSFLAIMIAIVGMKCVRINDDDDSPVKGYILLSAGLCFIVSAIAVLIPVSWTGHNIIRDFYNPLVHVAQKRELGEALYIGWVTALILFVAGVILCCACKCKENPKYTYSLPHLQQYNYAPSHQSYQPQPIERRTSSKYSRSQYV
uniref:Claudin n=2 Tax=Latimeria chalumnae TaxID=7897 RepID=H3ATD3_LATCH